MKVSVTLQQTRTADSQIKKMPRNLLTCADKLYKRRTGVPFRLVVVVRLEIPAGELYEEGRKLSGFSSF